jgi:hypothetical protein
MSSPILRDLHPGDGKIWSPSPLSPNRSLLFGCEDFLSALLARECRVQVISSWYRWTPRNFYYSYDWIASKAVFWYPDPIPIRFLHWRRRMRLASAFRGINVPPFAPRHMRIGWGTDSISSCVPPSPHSRPVTKVVCDLLHFRRAHNTQRFKFDKTVGALIKARVQRTVRTVNSQAEKVSFHSLQTHCPKGTWHTQYCTDMGGLSIKS